jgi:hypothetical protein
MQACNMDCSDGMLTSGVEHVDMTEARHRSKFSLLLQLHTCRRSSLGTSLSNFHSQVRQPIAE